MKFQMAPRLRLVILPFLLTIGCGEAANAPHAGTLSVVETSRGVTGSYSRSGQTIYFDAVRGNAVPKTVLDGDSSAPKYEIDVRYLDSQSLPFLVQVGGHGFIERQWLVDLKDNADLPFDVATRVDDFLLVAEAAKALAAEGLVPNHTDEMDALIQVGQSVSDVLWDNDDAAVKTPFAASPGSGATTYRHVSAIRKKGAFFNGSPADHSALRVNVYAPIGALVAQFSTSNHGTAATSTSMTTSCSATYYRSITYSPILEETCSTWYGFTPGTHVCNDDTANQYKMEKDFWAFSDSPLCSDWSLAIWAPPCN